MLIGEGGKGGRTLVTEDGGGGVAEVGVDQLSGDYSVTEEGLACGTLGWRSIGHGRVVEERTIREVCV